MELLCYTPNLRMEISRFVPAYHAHFGRQLRVAYYGCVKLGELFELIPEQVTVTTEANGEKSVRLTVGAARPVMAHRLRAITPVALSDLSAQYAAYYGAPPAVSVVYIYTQRYLLFPWFRFGCIYTHLLDRDRFGDLGDNLSS